MSKKCPFCGEMIADTAKKCRFCGEWLEPPVQQPPVQQPQPVQQPPAMQHPVQQQPIQQPPVMQQPVVKDNRISFFEAYFKQPYLNRYADFKGVTGRKAFWFSILFYNIVSCGVLGLALLLAGVGGLGGMIAGAVIMGLFSLGTMVPMLALCVRRLRDAGISPWLILITLIPFIGSIILIVLLCKASRNDHSSDDDTSWLPIDTIITAACVVIFGVGIGFSQKAFSNALGGGLNEQDLDYVVEAEDSAVVVDEPVEVAMTAEMTKFYSLTDGWDIYGCGFSQIIDSPDFLIAFQAETGRGYLYDCEQDEVFYLSSFYSGGAAANYIFSISDEEDGESNGNTIRVNMSDDNTSLYGRLVPAAGEEQQFHGELQTTVN